MNIDGLIISVILNELLIVSAIFINIFPSKIDNIYRKIFFFKRDAWENLLGMNEMNMVTFSKQAHNKLKLGRETSLTLFIDTF